MAAIRSVVRLFALALFVAFSSAAAADELDDIMKAGVIKIAVPQDFPPFGSVGKDLAPEGYDVDVARLVAKELGVKIEIVPVTTAFRTCRQKKRI